jgi:hypothetical protein
MLILGLDLLLDLLAHVVLDVALIAVRSGLLAGYCDAAAHIEDSYILGVIWWEGQKMGWNEEG